jgi:hypothetical protein
MKKGILILLGMFLMVSTVEAKKGYELPNRFGVNYSYNNAVNFVEKGIQFHIFTNGEFDFNTRYNDTYHDYNGKRTRNNSIAINRDFRGRIRTIGSVFINYDIRGNVTRIGNVFIRYRRGRLTSVGNLSVYYDRGGYPNFNGYVRDNFYVDNGIRINLNIGDVCDYNDGYFSHRDFRRNYTRIREDNNFFYYRANANANIGKRSTILRRIKPATVRSKRGVITNNNRDNNTYRKNTSVNSKRKITPKKRSINRKPSVKNSKRRVTTKTRKDNNSYTRSSNNKRTKTLPKVKNKKGKVVRNSKRN